MYVVMNTISAAGRPEWMSEYKVSIQKFDYNNSLYISQNYGGRKVITCLS